MEKKGDLLNQLAIISDLIENINTNMVSSTIIIEQDKENFDRTFKEVQKKYGIKTEQPDDNFQITIGFVDIIFNKNSV
jgi:hypothetical protein